MGGCTGAGGRVGLKVEDHELIVLNVERKVRDNQEQTHYDLHFLERASATRTPAERFPSPNPSRTRRRSLARLPAQNG